MVTKKVTTAGERKRRTASYTDGIHQLVETFTSLDGSDIGDDDEAVRALRERRFLTTAQFDREIKPVEAAWSPLRPPAGSRASWPDRAFYAKHIMSLIDGVREHLGPVPDYHPEQAVVLAFRLGALSMDADWRAGQGDRVRKSIARVNQTRRAGQGSQRRRRTAQALENEALWAEICRYYRAEPSATQKEMLSEIGARRGITTAKGLEAFRARVRRLTKNRGRQRR